MTATLHSPRLTRTICADYADLTKVRRAQYGQHRNSSSAALRRFRAGENADAVTFIVKYVPYELYPEASKEGEDKYAWYRKSRYADSDQKMKMYETLMKAYGVSAGINYKFGGT